MKLTVLGSGSPEAYVRRASSGHLLDVGDQRILFDCGGGVFDRLLQIGLVPSDIDILFFSHLHSDHMMDYARLVHAAWDEGGKALRVFGPKPIAEITKRFFGPDGALAYDLVARTELQGSQEVWLARGGRLPRPWPAPEVVEIEAGFSMVERGWEISSCAVPHAQPYLTCMAYALVAEGKKFVYSGDAGMSDTFAAFSQDADLLLHWCYRLSDQTDVSDFYKSTAPTPPEIAEMAARQSVKRLVLTHFRKHMDDPEKMQTALQQMQRACAAPCVIAEDLDQFEI